MDQAHSGPPLEAGRRPGSRPGLDTVYCCRRGITKHLSLNWLVFDHLMVIRSLSLVIVMSFLLKCLDESNSRWEFGSTLEFHSRDKNMIKAATHTLTLLRVLRSSPALIYDKNSGMMGNFRAGGNAHSIRTPHKTKMSWQLSGRGFCNPRLAPGGFPFCSRN